jgi:hypothetical protein
VLQELGYVVNTTASVPRPTVRLSSSVSL